MDHTRRSGPSGPARARATGRDARGRVPGAARRPRGASRRATRPPSPFVGRDGTVEHALGLLRSRTVPVLVTGEPGIGKSRLLREIGAQLATEGWSVATGRAWDGIDAPPYWPWTQVARTLVGREDGTDLAEVLFEEPEETEQFELFDATASLLKGAAAERPLLVVLDDLHAADLSTALLLRFVVQHVGDHEVAVVGAFREAEVTDRPDLDEHLEALAGIGTALPLDGLDVADVAALLGDPTDAEVVHAATGGNPLFVEQVARLTAVDGEQPGAAGQPSTDALQAVIAARIGLLGPDARLLLTALAVISEETDLPSLRQLVAPGGDRTVTELDAAVDELLTAGLLQLADGDLVGVTHSLVAATAVQTASPRTVEELHARAANLAADDPDRVAERAHHLLRAGPTHADEAGKACRDAARSAAAASAPGEAVAHLDRARAVTVGRGDRFELEVLLELGRAQRLADRPNEAQATFELAGRLADALDDVEGRALAAIQGGVQYYFRSDRDLVSVDRCEAALAALPPEAGSLRVRLMADLAGHDAEGDPARSRALAAEAVALGREVGDPGALGCALAAEQVTDLGPTALPRRMAAAREVIELGRRSGEHSLTVMGRFLLFGALLEHGDLRDLDAELRIPEQAADHLTDRLRGKLALWVACSRHMLDGRFDAAEQAAERCLGLALEHDTYQLRVYGGQISAIRMLQGRGLEVEAFLLGQQRANPDELLWRAVLARLWATNERPDAARGALAEVDPGALGEGLHWLLTMSLLAEAAALTGDEDLCRTVLGLMLPYADRFVPINAGAAVWGTVARPLGLLARRLGRADQAVSLLDQAVGVAARLGARPWLAEAQLDLVDTMLEAGRADGSRIRDLLAEARATAAQLDLAVLVDRADSLLAAAGTAGPRPAASAVAPAAPQISVLGAFEVTAGDGRVTRWTSRKARELLKILVTERGRPVHREVLMDRLWPGEAPETLGNRLSVALSLVRRALDPDRSLPTGHLVVADRGAVRLRLDRLDIDVEHFLDLAEQALDAHAADRSDALDLLRQATRAHRGPALPDEPYAEWAAPLQREVEVAYLRVARALADRAAGEGDDLLATDGLRRLVEADPFDDDAQRDLRAALERLGSPELREEGRRSRR